MADQSSTETMHPIRVVSRRTGLKPDVLRAWERRYGAIRPHRSGTKRRLYTDADILRVNTLRRAIESGRSIGQIATLSDEELERLIAQDRPPASTPAASTGPTEPGDREHPAIRSSLRAIRLLDGALLAYELDRVLDDLGRRRMLEKVVVPLLARIGAAWHSGELRISHEHLASAVIRAKVGSVVNSRSAPYGARRIIVTTPPGQLHEIGALLAAANASSYGWSVSYLGPNLPLDDIVHAAEETAAAVVALSLTVELPETHDQVTALRARLSGDVRLLIGGQALASMAEFPDGVDVLGSRSTLEGYLSQA